MEKNTTSRLTLKQKIGYGCGDAGGLFTFSLMSAFFTRYCLNILGVSTEMLATLLLVWNVWDAVNDPLMGTLMDKAFAKNHDKRGKFRPWILRATPYACGFRHCFVDSTNLVRWSCHAGCTVCVQNPV